MTEVRKNITLDAISQLATLFMAHHKEEDVVTINPDCSNYDFDITIEIKRVPNKKKEG